MLVQLQAREVSILQARLSRTGRIGGDARLTSVGEWHALSTSLQREGLQLLHIPTLLDTLWNEELDPARQRPDFSKIVARLHDSEYTGWCELNKNSDDKRSFLTKKSH